MKIYTKILIGMTIGATLGYTLGPRSPWLEKSSYIVADASRLTLRLNPADITSELDLPSKYPIELLRPLPAAGTQNIEGWESVRITVDEKLVLLDADGSLRQRLGADLHGTANVWLKPDVRTLEDGDTVTWPEPLSSTGFHFIDWLRPIGALFMRLIKMVIVPLVFTSLVVGVASLGDVRRLGRMGSKTIALYLVTTAIAIIIGLLIAGIVKPGHLVDAKSRAMLQAQFDGVVSDNVSRVLSLPSTSDMLLDMIPVNPAGALASGHMLQIIVFAVMLGVALASIGGSAVTLEVFDKIQQAMIAMIKWIMTLAPYGVAALMADVVANSGFSILKALFVYILVTCAGLLIHTVVVYGAMVRFGAGMSLAQFLGHIRPAQLIAFSTSSSAAALPVTIKCAEENMKISKSVASFVLPLGATVNMDGTALYQGVSAMFIAQIFGMDLSLNAQMTIVLTATLASIGTASVPGSGVINLALVLGAIGIPAEGIAIIIGADRVLDMFRTTVNVTGDLAVAAVVAKSENEFVT